MTYGVAIIALIVNPSFVDFCFGANRIIICGGCVQLEIVAGLFKQTECDSFAVRFFFSSFFWEHD